MKAGLQRQPGRSGASYRSELQECYNRNTNKEEYPWH